MNNTITFCTKSIQSIAVFSVIAMGIFVVLPILSLENGNSISAKIAFAQEFDYGSGGGEIFSDSYSSFDYGYGGGEVSSYASDYSTFDYGYGTGEVITNGCCDEYVSPDAPFDYGYGAGEIIANGCCDEYTYPDAPETYIATPTYTYTPAYEYEYSSLSLGIGGSMGIGYGGYSYGGYGGGYTYSYPTYTYTNPVYTASPIYTTSTFTSTSGGPTCTFTASDNTIDEDDSTTLRWTTNNATSVSINNGIGSVARDGSRVVSPNSTETYVLIAIGPGGSTQCSEVIIVDEDTNDDDDDDNVRCDAFTVSDSDVEEGDRVTLTWRTTGADDVRINNGVGDVSDDGSERVTIDEDTTFTLTARNGNDTDTCRVSIDADEDNDSDNDNDAIPRCTLRISDTTITSGQSVTLSWDNLRTDRVVLRDNHGNEIADSGDDSDLNEDDDSIVVRPTRSTNYTLTAYNGSDTRTCTVGTTVGGISLTSVRTQDTIALSQVPYTGFEAGTVLTIIFYSAIVLWGIAIAYALVFKKNPVAVRSQFATQPVMESEISPSTASDTATIEHSNSIPFNLPIIDGEDVVLPATDDTLHVLEEYAHTKTALISSDALRYVASQGGAIEEQIVTLDRVIALAKAQFPKEDEWIVINKERVISLLS